MENIDPIKIRREMLARAVYEAGGIYSTLCSNESNHPAWSRVGEETKELLRDAVDFWDSCDEVAGFYHTEDSTQKRRLIDLLVEKSHQRWWVFKGKHGWKYGPVKDEKSKTHPCMVPYSQLSNEIRLKNYIAVTTYLEVGAPITL